MAIEFEAFQVTRQRKSLGSIRECVPEESEHNYGELICRFSQMETEVKSLRAIQPNKVESSEDPKVQPSAKERRCYLCGEPGHFKAACPSRKPSGKTDGNNRCDFCGRQGHKMLDCRKYMSTGSQSNVTCVYCGLKGHFMIDCDRYKASLKASSREPLN